jgi:hypothetical protein
MLPMVKIWAILTWFTRNQAKCEHPLVPKVNEAIHSSPFSREIGCLIPVGTMRSHGCLYMDGVDQVVESPSMVPGGPPFHQDYHFKGYSDVPRA